MRQYQRDFTPDEFRARRQKLCEALGADGWILLQGAGVQMGVETFRQDNAFYYFSGVEVPHAYLLINAADAQAILFLPHEAQVGREADGEILCAENAEAVGQVTGVDQTLGVEALPGRLVRAGVLYVPFDGGQTRAVSAATLRSWSARTASDPWDGRQTRAARLVETVRRRFPRIDVRDASAAIAELRLVKSPAEIALLRRAGQLTAEGIREAMRSTRPGVMEYQLDAVMRYHYVAGGAAGCGYHAIVAGGANMWYGHYSRNDCELADGDWVLGDCAPDYHGYTSDIGRIWPVNGTYSPDQRALYGFVVEYHKTLLAGIRPGRMLSEINEEAAEVMAGVLADWRFGSPEHEEAARAMFAFRGHLSHCVGMTVHDGGLHHTRPLEPGIVFSVDPQMKVPDEKLYVRAEDTVVVTDDGIENLTSAAPLELDDVEAFMQEDGLLQTFPPV